MVDGSRSRRDLDALKRAMKQIRRHDKFGVEQIDRKLAEEPWDEVAKFAAYNCQIRALKLKPWEDPPCCGDVDGDGAEEAAALLRKMLAAGISRWEPNPPRALAAAKATPDA
jgi:hypothetical protein